MKALAVLVAALPLLMLNVAGIAADNKASSGVCLRASGSLELDGDSTLHRYSSKTRELKVLCALDGANVDPATRRNVEALIRGQHIKTLDIDVPVDALSSGEAALDRNMRKALKRDRFAEIQFHMDSYTIQPPTAPGAALAIVLRGRLRVAGVERTVALAGSVFRASDGLRVVGGTDLLMTDFQVTPPVLMMGMLKTADKITVKFEVDLRPAAS